MYEFNYCNGFKMLSLFSKTFFIHWKRYLIDLGPWIYTLPDLILKLMYVNSVRYVTWYIKVINIRLFENRYRLILGTSCIFRFWLRAIQLIRNTQGGGGQECHQITQGGGRGLTKVSRDIFCLYCIELFLERKLKFYHTKSH